MKYKNLVSYFGGKFPHLKWLTSHFPTGNYHFVDLMCGSANVALNVDYPLITVNDLNDNIINLFEVLRNNYDEFLRALYFTPFSRAELYKIIESEKPDCKIEWARHYFVKCQLGYGANGSQNDYKGAGFEYSIARSNFYRVDNWNVKLNRLASISAKLRTFQIESKNALELIDKVDKPTSIIYVDPPYLFSTRHSGKRYLHEVDLEFHENLLDQLKGVNNAFVAISGYSSELYDDLLTGFYRSTNKKIKLTISKKPQIECLWTNYDYKSINRKNTLFQNI